MLVYIVRHAWAGHYGDPNWPDDTLRPLTADGKTRFAQVAKTLSDRGVCPAVIASSPLVRCRQTADILAKHIGSRPEVIEQPALEPGSDFAEACRWTSQQNQGDVAWVGHSPDVSHFVARFIGGGDSQIRFAKGACAAVSFDGQFDPGRGVLQWLVTAKMLGC